MICSQDHRVPYKVDFITVPFSATKVFFHSDWDINLEPLINNIVTAVKFYNFEIKFYGNTPL